MQITAKIIKGIKYTPFLERNLTHFSLSDLAVALTKDATFFLDIDEQNKLAVSWWVSAKRTRSYPYSRIYDSYGFSGKKVTIIPIFKDEGAGGDRDFLQWDTMSLMSLLKVYVIIAYYKTASKSIKYKTKITKQRFDISYLNSQITALLKYQDDALHWNLDQISKINVIGNKAIKFYGVISKKTKVKMHSRDKAFKKINELMKDKKTFLKTSRDSSLKAQIRESSVTHLAELVDGSKATLTISNYLGGNYYFTSDEVHIKKGKIFLTEAKNTKDGRLPSLEDIKDGLLKMILFTNLENVEIDGKRYSKVARLKLTSASSSELGKSELGILRMLKKEGKINGFKVEVNGKFIN